jgi:hypothetical protein
MKLIVFADVFTVAKEISSEPSKNLISKLFEPEFVVSSHKVPATAPLGLDVPECIELIAESALFKSDLKLGND